MTSIRHVTKPGANLLLELGFPAEEAARLQAASRQQINELEKTSYLLLNANCEPSLAGYITCRVSRQ